MHRGRLAVIPVLTAAALASGTAGPSPRTPLPFFYDLYTFRGPAGGTTVVSSFAVEAGRLGTEDAGDRIRYRFSVTLVLADTAKRTISNTHDTVYVDVRQPLEGEHLLYTHVETVAPPSRTTRQRLLVMDATTPGVGQLYEDDHQVPDYGGTDLMLSDIAFGQPDARTGWKRGAATIAILPSTRFPPDVFDVYYEIYNLPFGHDYTTEIAIERLEPGAMAGEPVRLRFSGQSRAGRDGLVPELRRVDAQLSRGSYRLTVTITDLASGKTATRARSFVVQGAARGATPVSALRRTSGSRH